MRTTLFAGLALLMTAALVGTPAGSGPSPSIEKAATTYPVLHLAQSIPELEISLTADDGQMIEVLVRDGYVAGPNGAGVRFPLMDGQALTFAMPNRVETLFTFRRTASEVTVTSRNIEVLEMVSAD